MESNGEVGFDEYKDEDSDEERGKRTMRARRRAMDNSSIAKSKEEKGRSSKETSKEREMKG